MQRNSVAVRQLIHYKGQPDPLKGDALNKSVRETAQEALSAIFSREDNSKPPPPQEGLTQRIQGFGNTNFDVPSDDKKSFLSDMVGIGSATIKQGLNSLSQAQTHNKNDTGAYRGPNMRRSLTNESSYSDSKELSSQAALSSRSSTNAYGSWGQDLKTNAVVKCSESPQASLRENANKVSHQDKWNGVCTQETLRIARKGLLKTQEKVTGLGICVEVVKNKLAPAMKKAELEIECGGEFCVFKFTGNLDERNMKQRRLLIMLSGFSLGLSPFRIKPLRFGISGQGKATLNLQAPSMSMLTYTSTFFIYLLVCCQG
ncbi:unnamed protein product [Lactuca virosa]|uniref:Uncharacterized protein n=1 Tax=Lactuca virosa TaxID=75947 RepID=A0AAU9NJ28_9ASTR|nr:unnamed protein product [Lactuca virosa]